MKPVSDKRKEENVLRRELLELKFGPRHEWTCRFNEHRDKHPEVQVGKNFRTCWGPIDGHEIIKRSRGGSITDMEIVTTLCRLHNGWVEDHPLSAHRLGLADHSWDVIKEATVDE